MKIVTIPKFMTPYGAIEFVPVSDVPGSSHRVAVNGVLQMMWIPEGTPRIKRRRSSTFAFIERCRTVSLSTSTRTRMRIHPCCSR
jgi:hypothetical protein